MDKLKKIFKHDSSSSPQSSNAAADAISEKPSGVLMTTNYGDIKIALYSDKTPKASAHLTTHAIRHIS
jgi:hypothetical protein